MKQILFLFFTCISLLSEAQTNYALSFNGSSQYVSIGSPIPSASSYTKEAWVYAYNGTGAQNIISSNSAPFWINSGTLSAGQGGSFALVSSAAFPTNRWVHVAVTYDVGTATMRLYRDGILVSTATSVPAFTAEATFIASHQGATSFLVGLVDEVRIWTTALSAENIKKNMFKGPPAGAANLVSNFKFDDGSGTVLTNAAGGTNGTLQNGPTWVASPVQFSPNALHFDGSNDHIVIPHSVSSNFTIEFLMNTTTTGGGGQWYGGRGIIDAEVGGVTNDWGISLSGNRVAFGIGNPDITIVSASDVNTGNWVHVAATWNQATGQMLLYVNGVLEATGSSGTALRNAPPRITIGQIQTNINHYTGALDEIRIWNTVRTQTQIQANMNAELDPATETALVSYYTFDGGITAGTNSGLTVIPDLKNNNNGTLTNFALTGSTSNFVAQYSSLFTLPLQWLGFTASVQGNKAALNWSTANEQNTDQFLVQHSSNNSTWNTIGTVAAVNNNQTVNAYGYTHHNPFAGINYYRILQTDLDGKFSYSKVASVKFSDAIASVIVLSNPSTNGTIQLKLNQPEMLLLYNSNGKIVWKQQATAGNLSINASGFAKGIYWLHAGNKTQQIILQ